VVSLAPSLTEMLFALGVGNAVVGVTSYCNFPPAARRLPKVGGIEDGSIDFERVLGRKPDMVVAIGEGQERTVSALRRLGLRVEVVPSQTVGDVFRAIPQLGDLVGQHAAAERLVGDLDRRFARVRRAVSGLPREQRPRVFYELWDQPLMTATRSTLIGGLIELAGGRNIFGDLASRYPQVSPEAVLERDPEVIVAPDHHGDPVDVRSLVERTGLGRVEAARRGRILIVEGDTVSRAGPRIADILELLAHELHPDLVPPPGGGVRR
jgi:iron complex transport system substrate-binding protein